MATKQKPWVSRLASDQIEHVDPKTIIANPLNAKRHGDNQRAAINTALEDVGWVGTVIINKTSGRLIDGHMRVEEAVERREPTIPVVYVNLTAEQEKRVLLSYDPIALLATFDEAALTGLMLAVGQIDPTLDRMLASLARMETESLSNVSSFGDDSEDSDGPPGAFYVGTDEPGEEISDITTDNECPKCHFTW